MRTAAIVGAGPMGLAAALFLAEKGYAPVIFEADDRPGGMSASFDFDGTVIERYYHFVNRPDQHLFKLLDRLGLASTLKWQNTLMGFAKPGPNGNPVIHPWGNPVALLNFPHCNLITRLRYGLHAFSCKFLGDLAPLDDQSARIWISRWEGSSGYDAFWRPLFEKKFFELADPLSAAWIASRIRRVANSRDSLMKESLGYLEGGCQELLDKLIENLKPSGELRLNEAVREISRENGQTGAVVATDRGRNHFDAVISTIPLPYLAAVMTDPPGNYRDALKAMINIGCVCVLFRLGRPLTNNFWLNLDMPGWDIPGVIEYSNLRPMKDAYVYVPFYMPHTHPNWSLTNEDLIEKARGYLTQINPTAMEEEQTAVAFRYEYAQPICPPGFRRLLPPYETGWPGVMAADTAHSFPEDRSINESIRIAAEMVYRLNQ